MLCCFYFCAKQIILLFYQIQSKGLESGQVRDGEWLESCFQKQHLGAQKLS